MQAFRADSVEQQRDKMFSYARPDLPGSFFWHFIDRMVKDQKMTWTKAYKGISYIRDPGLSIIHSNEPDQILVLNPRIIQNVQVGENKQPTKFSDTDKIEQWMHALIAIIRRVRGEYGGDLTWDKKKPTLTFAKGVGKFTLTITTTTSGQMEPGLTFNYTYGRAYDSMYFKGRTLQDESLEQIVQSIIARVEKVAVMKTDLLFKPIISIEGGKQMMIRQIADNLGMSIRTTIYNSTEQRYNQVSMHGEVQREIDRVPIKTAVYLSLTPDNLGASANVWVGKHYMISAPAPYDEDYTEPAPMLAAMAAKVHENLTTMLRQFAPRTEFSSHDNHPRFHEAEQVPAFMGWLALNSGLSLNGELKNQFANEIAAFEAYPDRRVLLSDIAYIMNSRW